MSQAPNKSPTTLNANCQSSAKMNPATIAARPRANRPSVLAGRRMITRCARITGSVVRSGSSAAAAPAITSPTSPSTRPQMNRGPTKASRIPATAPRTSVSVSSSLPITPARIRARRMR